MYERLSYYERWTASLQRQMVDKGILTQDEIDAKVAEVRKRLEESGELELRRRRRPVQMIERFREGDIVVVREDYAIGISARCLYPGQDRARHQAPRRMGNPETLAYGLKGEKKYVYEVRFRQAEVWPTTREIPRRRGHGPDG